MNTNETAAIILTVHCTFCMAGAYWPCREVRGSGKTRRHAHKARKTLAFSGEKVSP